VAAGRVHEQGQRIGRARDLLSTSGRRRHEARVGRIRLRLVVDVDGTRLELRPQLGELVGIEVVLDRVRLELVLSDGFTLLRFLEEGVERCFNDGAQIYSLL
jgi:hypothetical protein